MKIKNTTILSWILVLIMVLCGCQSSNNHQDSAGGSSVVPVPEDSSFAEEDALDYVYDVMGDTLVVKLDSNQTTGCSWASSDLVNLEETESFYTSNENNTELAGVGGIETHAFKALAAGEASVKLSYGQHWEGGSTFEVYLVSVTVDEELNITDVQFQNEELPENEWEYAQEHPESSDE